MMAPVLLLALTVGLTPSATGAPTIQEAPSSEAPSPPKEDAPFAPELAAPEGLAPWLVAPVQVAVGALLGIPLVVIFPIAPFLVAFVVASVGDLLGQQRGPVLWPMVGGYVGMIAGGLLPLTGWGIAFGLGLVLSAVGLLLGGGMMTMGLPVVIAAIGVGLLYITGITTFVVPAAMAVVAAAGEGCGAAVGYFFSAEDKRPGDVEFRFPGFIAPSHGPDRYLVRMEPHAAVAMAY